ncbi:MAG: DUF1559 domain-containing protein [Planctomycetaceae bacterium]|nr:DUF1559 domain-containing protein [Planctomycetaceae bacterium]
MLELIWVVLIIITLVSLLLPAIQTSRESARNLQCINNLNQVGLAMHQYHQSFRVLPSGSVDDQGPVLTGRNRYAISWIAQILPYLGETGTYRQIDFQTPRLSMMTPIDRDRWLKQESQRTIQEMLDARTEQEDSTESGMDEPIESAEPQEISDAQGNSQASNSHASDSSTPDSTEEAAMVEFEFAAGEWDPVSLPSEEQSFDWLLCPSSPDRGGNGPSRFAGTHYAGCSNSFESPIDITNDGLLYLNSSERLDEIPDGASQTVLLGEHTDVHGGMGWLFGDAGTLKTGTPLDHSAGSRVLGPNIMEGSFKLSTMMNADRDQVSQQTIDEMSEEDRQQANQLLRTVGGFGSHHPQHINFAFADGSVRSLNKQIDPDVFRRLCNRRDGTVISNSRF